MVALDNTIGALFIGVVLAAVLYGFTCIQTWYYYINYPSDPWHIKLLVAGILFSDTCHQCMITHAAYTYSITYFGNFEELGKIVPTLTSETIPNALTTFLVQCFLVMRVYRLSNRNLFATGSSLLLVTAGFVASMIFASKAIYFTTFAQLATLKSLSMTVNVLSAVGDLVIAVYLCYMLQSSRTGFRRSDTLITKLMVFSINTGLLTSLCAIGSLVSIVAWPHTFIYITFYFCIGRLYCNTLLATLNARKGLRDGCREDDISMSFQSRSVHRNMNHTTFATSSKCVPNNISIKIDTTKEYVSDEQYASSGDVKNPQVDLQNLERSTDY